MTATTANPARRSRGNAVRLLLGFLLIIGTGVALAWLGAGSLRAEVTKSGLEFRSVKAGKGAPIDREDVALIQYRGTLDDGTVFDSSENHGGAQPMTIQGMIPGFAEAMTRMREGGEYKITLPPKLAYGDTPPPGLPANSSLHFDVKVEKIVRGAAAMLLQQQQMQQMQQEQGQGAPQP